MLTFLAVGFLLISLYANWNLVNKSEKMEDLVLKQDDFIRKFQEIIQVCSVKLSEIDEKGTFKSDDEIGWFFDEIKSLQNGLDQFVANNQLNGEDKKEKKT